MIRMIAAGLYAFACVSVLAAAGTNAGLAEADALAAKGKVKQALARYQIVVKADPRSALALRKLGGMQLATNQYSEAIRSFQASIGLEPGDDRAFLGMGIAYLHMGRYDLARAAFKEAKRHRPASAEIDRVLAWLDQRGAGVPSHHAPAVPHSSTGRGVKK